MRRQEQHAAAVAVILLGCAGHSRLGSTRGTFASYLARGQCSRRALTVVPSNWPRWAGFLT